MNNTKNNNILFYLAIAFSVFWFFAIGLDYINKHPIYYYGFKYFRFLSLTIGLLVVGLGFGLIEKQRIKLPFKIPINGLSLLFFGSVISYFIIQSNGKNVPFSTQSSDYMHYVSLTLKSSFQLILIYGILMSFGSRVSQWFYKNGMTKSRLLDIAFGIMVLVLLMFLLAALSALNMYSLMAIFVVMAALNFKQLLSEFKLLLWDRVDFSKFSLLGVMCIYGMFIFLLINFISIQNPFPNGFDARNYYGNISELLSQGNGLIKGYAPHNWSIFMAVGNLLGDQIELSLSISFSAFVLVLIGSYKLGVDKLGFDRNNTLFVLLMVAIAPALVNQLFVELKVDFGLLFFQMLIVYYLFEILPGLTKPNETSFNFKNTLINTLPGLALIGLLCGFGLGIKMINMFLLFSILAMLWWEKEKVLPVLCILFFTIALFLFAGIDELSGLRKYHLNVGTLKLLFILLFISTLGYGLVKQRTIMLKKIIYSGVFLCFTGISFSPWVTKNIMETKSLDPKTIMIGGSTGPGLNANSMTKKYKGSKK